LAKPVTDLRAVRKGDKVYLMWTSPTLTTDHHTIRQSGVTEICRSVGSPILECGTAVARIPRRKPAESKNIQGTAPAAFVDELPLTLLAANQTSSVSYGIRVLNSYGRTAGPSNQVQISTAPTLPPPNGFHADVTADGVRLTWVPISIPENSSPRFFCRVYRREQAGQKDVVAGEVPLTSSSAATLLDQTFEWEKTYAYRATVVTSAPESSGAEQRVEGDDTPSVTVFAHDVFPPAAPAGLQAVFSGPGQNPFIDLVWTPNSESDLAGYNIYRHEQGNPAAKVNSELVGSPAFRDNQVQSGRQYFYSITAVDVRGNESAPSQEENESVP
jgi:hypothetical protein